MGDINFTIAQENRGGGTVAFQCPPLWTSLAAILTETPASPKPGTTQKKTPAQTKASAAAKKATVPLAKQAIPKTATASSKAKSAQGKSGSAPAQKKSTKSVVSKKAVTKSKRK